MKQSINSYDFHRAFETMRPDNFSYEGLDALFDWFEQLEDDTGEEIELDVIAICCDFTESSIDEIVQDYIYQTSKTGDIKVFNQSVYDELQEYDDEHEKIEVIMDYLNDNTQVIEWGGDTIIYQAF